MNERILVVENTDEPFHVLRDKLIEKNFEVVTAEDELEFWIQMKDPRVKLVILDVCLKNRLSADVYHALLDFRMSREIGVILKTGLLTEDGAAVTALHDENYVFFPEPVNFDRLYAEIHHLLNKRRMVFAA